MFKSPGNGCFGQSCERDPPIAVPCQLGVEWDASQAGDLEARWPALIRVERFGRNAHRNHPPVTGGKNATSVASRMSS